MSPTVSASSILITSADSISLNSELLNQIPRDISISDVDGDYHNWGVLPTNLNVATSIGYFGDQIVKKEEEKVPVRTNGPIKAWFNPPYATVEFIDGKKITVKQSELRPFDKFAMFCRAIVKHPDFFKSIPKVVFSTTYDLTTVVRLEDGREIVVHTDDMEKWSQAAGYEIALVKAYYGTTSIAINALKHCEEYANHRKLLKEHEKELLKKKKEEQRKLEKEDWEFRVKHKMEMLLLEREARHRLGWDKPPED